MAGMPTVIAGMPAPMAGLYVKQPRSNTPQAHKLNNMLMQQQQQHLYHQQQQHRAADESVKQQQQRVSVSPPSRAQSVVPTMAAASAVAKSGGHQLHYKHPSSSTGQMRLQMPVVVEYCCPILVADEVALDWLVCSWWRLVQLHGDDCSLLQLTSSNTTVSMREWTNKTTFSSSPDRIFLSLPILRASS
jgi:hypothetical protein